MLLGVANVVLPLLLPSLSLAQVLKNNAINHLVALSRLLDVNI